MLVASLIAGSLGPLGCNESEDPGGPSAAAVAAAPAAEPIRELPAEPSALARRIFAADLLNSYRDVGDRVGVEWPILAAADKLEGGASSAADERRDLNRILAIAYTLEALGGAANYESALAQRGGDGYARRVLSLAQRLRTVDAPAPPAATLPLLAPAEGPVIAGYGQRYGVLHDGLDIDAETGAPVRAAAAGVVVSTGEHPIFGLHTCVGHRIESGGAPQDLTTCYGNQSAFLVEPGDLVRAGESIGQVGCTGTCLRPHVHFQVRLGGDGSAPTADPAPYMSASLAEQADDPGRPLEAQP